MCGVSSCLIFLILLLGFSSMACGRCVHRSKAGYFSSLSALSAGTCGYGSMTLGLSGGYVAAASSALLRGGVACGACFQQVRCRNTRICRGGGVKVILTDLNESNDTDLVLSRPAFVAMARHSAVGELEKLGTVDVEYKRIPCEHTKNLSIKVEEKSRSPNVLAIKFLYQGGQTDIGAVDVAQAGSSDWRFMSRVFGPVWSTSRAPPGPLQLRMVVTGGYGGKWVYAQSEALPVDWRTGSVYDLGVQITDIARGVAAKDCK
ncbi:unnamed protein product [Musa hybrid cultivar]